MKAHAKLRTSAACLNCFLDPLSHAPLPNLRVFHFPFLSVSLGSWWLANPQHGCLCTQHCRPYLHSLSHGQGRN